MSVRLPARENIRPIDADDPLHYYYAPLVGRLYRRRLELAARFLAGQTGRVLEVGYGSGVFLPELAGSPGVRVIGVDLHTSGASVRRMAHAEGVDAALLAGDVLRLPLADESVDALVCLSVLEHVRALDRAAAELRRVLRPGGVAVLGYPRVDRLMSGLFRAIGFQGIEDNHVSTPAAIEAAVRRELTLDVRRPWPRAPLPLYYVSRWRRDRAARRAARAT